MKKILKAVFLLSTLALFPVLYAAAQSPSQNAVQSSSAVVVTQNVVGTSVLGEVSPAQLLEDGVLRESQRQFDRSLNLLNSSISSMGVLTNLIAILLGLISVVIGFIGVTGYSFQKSMRKRMSDVEKAASSIENMKNKAEEDVAKIRAFSSDMHFSDKEFSPEYKKKLEELSRRMDVWEMMGVAPKPQDYAIRAAESFANGKYEESLVYMDKVIADNPKSSAAWYNKGVILGKLGKHEEVLKACDKAIALDPNHAGNWSNKGAALSRLGKNKEALEAFDKAISRDPNHAGAWANKGAALFKLKRYDEAIDASSQAIKLAPKDGRYYYNRTCAYAMSGEKEQALSDLREAVRLDGTCKQKAKTDEDFKSLWNDEDFKKIVNS